MPTPFPSRQAAPTSWSGAAKTKPTNSRTRNGAARTVTSCSAFAGTAACTYALRAGTSTSSAFRSWPPAAAAGR